MTFLHTHSWTAVGLNFLLSCMALQWSILTVEFFKRTDSKSWTTIEMDIKTLIEAGTSGIIGCARCACDASKRAMLADFGAGAAMISFGAVLGKVSSTQLLIMVFFEMVGAALRCRCSCLAARRHVMQIFYGINHMCVYIRLHAIDMGGSMVWHPP